MKILKKIKNANFHDYVNYFELFLARTKTLLLYRRVFGAVGKSVAIYKPLLIANPQRMFLGNGVNIRSGIRLEVIMGCSKDAPTLRIGNNVNIEQNVHIICGSKITIGNNVSITGGAAIVDVHHPYDDVDSEIKIGNRIQCDGNYIDIADGVFIGYGAIILPNVKIGKNAVIGAYSVVNKDVPEFSVVVGNPGRVVKKYCFETDMWEKI